MRIKSGNFDYIITALLSAILVHQGRLFRGHIFRKFDNCNLYNECLIELSHSFHSYHNYDNTIIMIIIMTRN